MKLGAHVSASGGPARAIDRALEIGAEAIQIFASSPRAWAFKPISEDRLLEFRQRSEETGVSPAFLHGTYLVNLGGTPELVEKSIVSLTQQMNAASQLGAEGVIFHGGSHKGAGLDAVFDQVIDALRRVLSECPPDVSLIVENSAGMGDHIGASFGEIGRVIQAVDSPHMKVCMDTEHTFAAGYDMTHPDRIEEVLEEFESEIGLSRLMVVHANDAKVELGSGIDRHENIGDGHMGLDGFEVIMGHPVFRDVPFILEVPGIEKKGPDKENVDRLKQVRQKLNIQA